MIATKPPTSRSVLFQSLRVVCPCNHLRAARLDFYGTIGLVCALSVAARLVQALLAD